MPLKVHVNQDRSRFLGTGFPGLINEAVGHFRSFQVTETVAFITLIPFQLSCLERVD